MAFKRAFFFVHVLLSTLSTPLCWAETGKNTAAISYDSSEIIETLLPPPSNNLDSHSTVLVYEGEDQDLVCFEENLSKSAQTLWLKNGREFEGEVENFSNTERFVPTIRSTLIVRAIQLSDNGIYTCIIFEDGGKPIVKTFDLLVTAARSGEMGTLFNQSGITAIIVIMTLLIVLMAIATALSYRLFCNNATDKQVIGLKPSKTFEFSRCFVLGTEAKQMKPDSHFPDV